MDPLRRVLSFFYLGEFDMQIDEIRQIFREVYNEQANFLTPTIINYCKKGIYVCEVSEDVNHTFYGVTIIQLPNTKRPDLSRTFDTYKELREYGKSLKLIEAL